VKNLFQKDSFKFNLYRYTVVAANAGGAFSPFGDLTTLMVWQKGKLQLDEFPKLLIPSAVNWLVPACLMNPYIKVGLCTS
jgi:Na+/H+ antiporter NhaD/arsenite permease-like protein